MIRVPPRRTGPNAGQVVIRNANGINTPVIRPFPAVMPQQYK